MILDLAKNSYIWHQKQKTQKKQIDKMDLSRIKNFCASKDIIKKWKDNPKNGKIYLQIMDLLRDGYLQYIKSSYNSMIKRQAMKKWAKDIRRYFYKEDIQMVNKHMKRCCSTSLVMRKMQIKPTIRHHFTPTRMTRIKNTDNSKCWQECTGNQSPAGM